MTRLAPLPSRSFASRRARLADRVRLRWLRASWPIEALLGASRRRRQRSEFVAEVIADLRSEGVHVSTVEKLLGPAAPAYREAMARAALLMAGQANHEPAAWVPAGASNDLAAAELLRLLPEFYLFGLNARVLSLAEQYLQVPVAYHGAVLRHSLTDGHEVGPRLWHRDHEDFHVLRVLVYLNDVGADGGPFEYIPRHLKLGERARHDELQMSTAATLQRVVPSSRWRQCLGPAGTVVIADTAQIFHHEALQRGRDRAVVMMGHSSRRPKNPALALSHFPVEANARTLAALVSPEHEACVFGWRPRMA